MITNKEIAEKIVLKVKENIDWVLEQFVFDHVDSDDDLISESTVVESATDPDCWNDMQGFGDGECDEYEIKDGLVERIFDCEPLDDQLRAYVYLKKDFSEIVEIDIQGE